MSEEIKQEGEFKIKTPSKPKNLGDNTSETIKVNMKEPLIDLEPDVKKVVIKKEDTDAVQTQETNDSDVIVEESKDSGNSEEVVKEVRTSDEEVASPLTVIEDTEEEEKQLEVNKEVEQAVQEQRVLPENIEKLVSFMEETGGTVEDYVRLNADYTLSLIHI